MAIQSYFPDYNVPAEVATHMLGFLEDTELVLMKRMGLIWRNCICGNSQLSNRLLRRDYLSYAFYNIDNWRRDDNFKELAKAYAHFDIPMAKEMIIRIRDGQIREKAVLESFQILTGYDIPAAKAWAINLKEPELRDQAFAEIVCAIATYDLAAAEAFAENISDPMIRSFAFHMHVRWLAEFDLPAACALALKIEDFAFERIAQNATVKALAKTDLTAAETFALAIVRPFDRITALLDMIEIGLKRLPNDPNFIERIENLLLSINAEVQAMWQIDQRHQLQLRIVKLEARFDIPAAEATLLKIEGQEARERAAVEIVKALAQKDIAAAEARVSRIQYPKHECEASMEILKVRAQYDIHAARASVQNYMPFWKASCYLTLAGVIQSKIGRTIIRYSR